VADQITSLHGQINAHAGVAAVLTATKTATTLTLTGRDGSKEFGVVAGVIGGVGGDTWLAVTTQEALPPNGKSWQYCKPPNFGAVRPTDRLSYAEAVTLARQHVWRTYRVRNVRPDRPDKPLKLPYLGEIKRRQQLLLQPEKVDQVRPLPRDKAGRDKGLVPKDPRADPGFATKMGGILPDFYDGYSRDQPAEVFGSVSKQIGTVFWTVDGELNTARDQKVYVPFTIDAQSQLVVFAEPVFRVKVTGDDILVEEPHLVLETAVIVLHEETGEPLRWTGEQLVLGGAGGVEWHRREDVAVSIIGEYGEDNSLTGFSYEGRDDARARAGHYLKALARRHLLTGGETRQYIGCLPIDPGGYVQQVTWSFGGSGATTTASANSEHDPWVPDYPARRRAENLPPDKAAAAANRLEGQFVAEMLPKRGEGKTP
jgi:hypothetical protein